MTTKLTPVTTGTMSVVPTMALDHMANQHRTAAEILSEYVDNGRDAAATHIWVICEKTKITVIDDGHGMIPYMHPADLETVRQFIDDMNKGRDTEGLDIRTMMQMNASLKSMQWSHEAVACSWKALQSAKGMTGTKGIGATAYKKMTQHGESIWLSKPCPQLIAECGDFADSIDPNATYRLHPPLQGKSLNYFIELSSAGLTDPMGQKLAHGTRLEFRNIKPEFYQTSRPEVLLRHFKSRYGENIKNGLFELVVIDKRSDEGKKSTHGIFHVVEPASYPGTQVLHRKGTLHGNVGEFEASIYFDPSGRSGSISLLRQGVEVSTLTAIEGFNRPPWNSPALSGYVTTPDMPEAEFPWLTDKKTPAQSERFFQWRRETQRMEDALNKALDQINIRMQQSRLQETVANVQQALSYVLSTNPEFTGLLRGHSNASGKNGIVPAGSKGPGRAKRQIPQTVSAVVMDEHGQGVPDMTVEMRFNGLREILRTGRSGRATLGEPSFLGQYQARLIIPPNSRLRLLSESDIQRKMVTEKEPGCTFLFKVLTGTPPPNRPSMPDVQISTHAWPDPDQPWRADELVSMGRIQINVEAENLSRALKRGDHAETSSLIALYAALAVCSILPGDSVSVLQSASNLLPSLIEAMPLQAAKAAKAAATRSKATKK